MLGTMVVVGRFAHSSLASVVNSQKHYKHPSIAQAKATEAQS